MFIADREQAVAAETKAHFLFSAQVSISALDFPYSRALDNGNIERLKRHFGRGACSPEKPEHHIPAIAKGSEIRDKLKPADEAVSRYPRLDLSGGPVLRCLRGLHRVRAAQNLVQPVTTWIVDIYDEGLSSHTSRE